MSAVLRVWKHFSFIARVRPTVFWLLFQSSVFFLPPGLHFVLSVKWWLESWTEEEEEGEGEGEEKEEAPHLNRGIDVVGMDLVA